IVVVDYCTRQKAQWEYLKHCTYLLTLCPRVHLQGSQSLVPAMFSQRKAQMAEIIHDIRRHCLNSPIVFLYSFAAISATAMSAAAIATEVTKPIVTEDGSLISTHFTDLGQFIGFIFLIYISLWTLLYFIGLAAEFRDCGITDPPPPFTFLRSLWELLNPPSRFMLVRYPKFFLCLLVWVTLGWTINACETWWPALTGLAVNLAAICLHLILWVVCRRRRATTVDIEATQARDTSSGNFTFTALDEGGRSTNHSHTYNHRHLD
ncbi:hypothetical protein BKA65DRAFT_569517, partial [Rhexocercosporidium sp. MPI-PUGE-AT-0058]